jgi:hypothetical protein
MISLIARCYLRFHEQIYAGTVVKVAALYQGLINDAAILTPLRKNED